MGCWGHLVLRPESGSQETEPQTQTTDPSSGSHGTKAFGEGTRGSHRIVPVSKDDIKQTHSGSNPHTPLSASLRQIILFCYQFSSVFKKKAFKKIIHSCWWGDRETYKSCGTISWALWCVLCCAMRASLWGRSQETPFMGVTCSEPGPGQGWCAWP